ncbi:MAG: helix-turn-helix transcriptional regulator [Gemmatimonadota bacterium]
MTNAPDGDVLAGFRDRLRLAMSIRGVTQTELGKRIGVRQATVSQWLSRTNPSEPKADQLLRLPEALGINGHWLLTGRGSMDDTPGEVEAKLEAIRRILDVDAARAAGQQRRSEQPRGRPDGGNGRISPGPGTV